MINFNGKEVTGYNDYVTLNGQDLLDFMKNQSIEDIAAFKEFAQTPKYTKSEDGHIIERSPNFFELRNWVLEHFEPGITAKKVKTEKTLIERIMEL